MNGEMVKLTVIVDGGGNVIATNFEQDPRRPQEGPLSRALPTHPEHLRYEFDVPAAFRDLPSEQLHESVKQLLRTRPINVSSSEANGPIDDKTWTPCVVGRLALENLLSSVEAGAPDVAALGHALIRTARHFAEQAFADAVPNLSAILFADETWSPELITPWRDFVVRRAAAPDDQTVVRALAGPLVRAVANRSIDTDDLGKSFWVAVVQGFRNGLIAEGVEFEEEEEDGYDDRDDPYVFIKVLCTERIDKLPQTGVEQKPLYCVQPQNNSAFSGWADTVVATELPDKIPNRLVILKSPEHSARRGYVVNRWSADLVHDHPSLYTEVIGPGDQLAIYRWDLYEGDLRHTKIDDLIAKARDKLQGEEEKLTEQAKSAAKDKVGALVGDAVQQIAQGVGGVLGNTFGGSAGAKIGEQAGKLAGDLAGRLVKSMIDLALDALADRTFPPVYVTLFTHYNEPKVPFCVASAISGDTLLTLSRPGTIPNPPVETPRGIPPATTRTPFSTKRRRRLEVCSRPRRAGGWEHRCPRPAHPFGCGGPAGFRRSPGATMLA